MVDICGWLTDICPGLVVDICDWLADICPEHVVDINDKPCWCMTKVCIDINWWRVVYILLLYFICSELYQQWNLSFSICWCFTFYFRLIQFHRSVQWHALVVCVSFPLNAVVMLIHICIGICIAFELNILSKICWFQILISNTYLTCNFQMQFSIAISNCNFQMQFSNAVFYFQMQFSNAIKTKTILSLSITWWLIFQFTLRLNHILFLK